MRLPRPQASGMTAWCRISAALGAVAWLAAPWLPTSPLTPGSLEHVFLFAPLVAIPLALAVLTSLCEEPAGACWQPVAAALLFASFLDTKGARAGALAAPWVAFAFVMLTSTLRRRNLRNPNRIAAHVFLLVGAVWLTSSRLGIGPPQLTPLRLFLGATHFHFSGFLLQVLIAATGRGLRDVAPQLVRVQRGIAIAAILAIVLLAFGNVLGLSPVKFVGVAGMVTCTLVLAFTMARVALASSGLARGLLALSAASVGAGMSLALVYGVGELAQREFIPLRSMVPLHGLVNALGFVLCGLLGHLAAVVSNRRGESAACPGFPSARRST